MAEIINKTINLFQTIVATVIFISTFSSCNLKETKPDFSKINVSIRLERFEKDLFSVPYDRDSITNYIPLLKAKYPDFFELFNNYIIQIEESSLPGYSDFLLSFLTDYAVQQSYSEVGKHYSDITFLEKDLNEAFRFYKYYFPDKNVPDIITYVGGFQQSIVVDQNLIAIGLDKYLGRDCELYEKIGIQNYFVRNMHKDKILSDCMTSWLKTEFLFNDSVNNVISQMIYHGKIYYATKKLLPKTEDSLIIGFTGEQIRFCEKNEKKMWVYLVEYNKLFSTDHFEINKLINEGPFTNGFSNKSPARAVTWIGWKIVDKYMDKNDVSLPNLMLNDNYMKIYNEARYNP